MVFVLFAGYLDVKRQQHDSMDNKLRIAELEAEIAALKQQNEVLEQINIEHAVAYADMVDEILTEQIIQENE